MGQLLLLVMLFTPLVAALLVLGTGSHRRREVRQISLLATLITLACAVGIAANYNTPGGSQRPGVKLTAAQPYQPDPQFEIRQTWMPLSPATPDQPASGIEFHLGIDGLGLWLVVLTALLMVPAVLISWEEIKENVAGYYALLLLLETGMLGVFCAYDLILFYIFFEFTLLPLFFIIGIWGGPQKRYAARKFFIYTLAGSLLGLVGLVAIVVMLPDGTGRLTFSIPELVLRMANKIQLATGDDSQLRSLRVMQWWIFLALFAGFAIKVPLFPFHTWLPLAHVEAPTAGSVLLAGVLLKLGTFGFLRLALPLLPLACQEVGVPLIGWLAVIGIIYGALCALAQKDIKKMVAYSSVSHLGFCMLGLFALNAEGISGGLLQMVNHGLSTGMLFLLVGIVYSRYHTRQMNELGGLAGKLPLMGVFWVFTCLSSAGLPGLNGFVGEFLCLAGMFQKKPLFAVLGTSGVILGAWYLLTLLQRCFFGPLKEPEHAEEHITDLNRRELCALVPLALACLWLGIYPKPFLDTMKPEVEAVAKNWEGKPAAPVPTPVPGPVAER
jgi:NADH-quinone oxidoreductase subunit M